MILIQGAGIAGLTLAASLQQQGLSYRLIEGSERLRPVGAGIVLQANACAVLARLDIETPVVAAGCWLQAMTLGPVHRARRFEFERPDAALGTHRAQLQAALLSRVPAQRIGLGLSIARCRERAQGYDVELSDGETVHASHVIGADGINSAIRRRLGRDGDLRISGQWCWRTVLPGRPSGAEGFELFNGRHRLGVVPISPSESYLYWVESGHLAAPQTDGRQLKDLDRFGSAVAPLAECWPADLEWLCHPLNDRPVYWGDGNVALIGDAAHPITPNMGQGAALAMEDAWCLAQVLGRGKVRAAPVLRRLRQSRVQGVRRASWLAGRAAHLHRQPARWLRDQCYARIPARSFLRSQDRFVNHFIEEMDHV